MNMPKKYLYVLMLLLIGVGICLLLVAYQGERTVAHSMPTESSSVTIYTALPLATNNYYRPFTADLKSFNYQLAKDAPDNVTTITKQQMTNPTSRFTYDDIWLRDVAPVITTRMVKFHYAPNYLPKTDSNYLDHRFRTWLKQQHFNYQTSNLVLDGGNLIWNQHDTVILTDHVFADNPSWSRSNIIDELRSKLEVNHVVIIPGEPGDILGHADGMVKFIDANTLYLSDFLGDTQLVQTVKNRIKAALPNAKFVILPSAYTSKGQYDKKIASAKGLYVNMLETPDTIYVPYYDLPMDQQVLKIVRQHTKKHVVSINVAKISTTGGSVHCLTWDVPNRFKLIH